MTPSAAKWEQFLAKLQSHFLRCHLPSQNTNSWLIYSDASKLGWGAILIADGHVVRCASGLWPANFMHHISNELELEAICRAFQVFRPWLFGRPVQVVVDNQAVLSFQNPSHLSDFLKRRLDHLLTFSPSIVFSSGSFNFLQIFFHGRDNGFLC